MGEKEKSMVQIAMQAEEPENRDDFDPSLFCSLEPVPGKAGFLKYVPLETCSDSLGIGIRGHRPFQTTPSCPPDHCSTRMATVMISRFLS